MKKLIYLLSALTIGFTSCDPLDDTYNQLDKINPDVLKKDVTLAITTSYTTEDAAVAAIPTLINKSYPQLDNGSGAIVTYNLVTYTHNNNLIASRTSYTLVNTDYALGGTTFTNFNSWTQIETFLKAKYPSPAEGDLVTLTFAWFNSNVSSTAQTITDSYYYKGGQWYDAYHVSNAEYTSVDRGRFNNFVAADQAILPDYFNKFLKAKILVPKVGDIQYVSFANRPVSTTLQEVMAMRYDGSNWVKITANIVEPTILKFAKKNGVWVPDLTIKYTLVTDDYVWIGDNSTAGTADSRANLKSYKNFYQANPSSPNYWSDAQIEAALASLLKNKYPDAEIGQKYQLTYVVYTGSNTVRITTLIKNDAGDYVLFSE